MEEIDSFIKKEIVLNDDLFYHAFKDKNMESIYRQGILCNFLQHKETNGGYNGSYYVSVCKRDDKPTSAYKMFKNSSSNMFILDSNIKAIKATNHSFPADYFMNTIVPIRSSCYSDEYQVFLKVARKYIKGLRLSKKKDLIDLRNLITFMNHHNIELPIYDYTYEQEGIIREIEKEKIIMKI